METLTISLPAALKTFVEEQLTTGNYKTPSTYITALLRAERKRLAEEKLLALLKEADASGPATPMTAQDWQNIHRKGLAQLAEQRQEHAKDRQKTRGRK